MDLRRVVRVLNQCCAPHLADTWDNVGLLVQSSEAILVSRVLVTNDLTEPVLSEARERETNLIVSYHPPIFSPLKRITNSHWKERLIAACLENRIAIYSPHTGLDAKMNGVNDWLLSPFGLCHVQFFNLVAFFPLDLISKKPITPVPHREESMTKLTLPISESFSQFYMNLSGTPVSARLSWLVSYC
ncbi:putative GTP cyclohydrolase 1 type 2 NIF3L1 [Fasciola hepatica]|uniref:NIF3-like protein 1 n=1 Tax=Fasciola hepatica TaxID=6192 RepID=A0A4E0R6P8_FASHE|nr:putative GTP cyclohydrolase 1 type 2 NIF3L1 [Fasciola hepatica]